MSVKSQRLSPVIVFCCLLATNTNRRWRIISCFNISACFEVFKDKCEEKLLLKFIDNFNLFQVFTIIVYCSKYCSLVFYEFNLPTHRKNLWYTFVCLQHNDPNNERLFVIIVIKSSSLSSSSCLADRIDFSDSFCLSVSLSVFVRFSESLSLSHTHTHTQTHTHTHRDHPSLSSITSRWSTRLRPVFVWSRCW